MTTVNSEPTCDCGPLDDYFATARRHESALQIALKVGDPVAGLVTAARLGRILRLAADALDAISVVGSPSQRWALLAMFQESTRGMYELLRGVPGGTAELDSQRMVRWLRAAGRSAVALGGPDLFEVDATGIDLSTREFLGLHVARCRFMTGMQGTRVLGALLEHCDFMYSDLRNTLWQRTHVHQSFFRDSSLVDATFDDVSFVDCDLRRADLSVMNNQGSATTHVTFLRCDLRGTSWTGRDLSSVRVRDCRLDGPADRVDSSQVMGGDPPAARVAS